MMCFPVKNKILCEKKSSLETGWTVSALHSPSVLCVCPLECLIITGLITDPHTVAKAAAVLIPQISTTSYLSPNYYKDVFVSKTLNSTLSCHSDYKCTWPGQALGNIASHLFGKLCLSDLEQVEPMSLLFCSGCE